MSPQIQKKYVTAVHVGALTVSSMLHPLACQSLEVSFMSERCNLSETNPCVALRVSRSSLLNDPICVQRNAIRD